MPCKCVQDCSSFRPVSATSYMLVGMHFATFFFHATSFCFAAPLLYTAKAKIGRACKIEKREREAPSDAVKSARPYSPPQSAIPFVFRNFKKTVE